MSGCLTRTELGHWSTTPGETQGQTAATKMFALKALWNYRQNSLPTQEGQILTIPTVQAATEGSLSQGYDRRNGIYFTGQFYIAVTETIEQGDVESSFCTL